MSWTFPSALLHLADQPIWIGWYWGPIWIKDGSDPGKMVPKLSADGKPKLTKVPCDAGGNNISFKDPAQWRTYAQLMDAVRNGVISGVGIAAAANEPVSGGSWLLMDIDHCRDPATGQIDDWAWGIVEAAQSYTEVSPSGRGLRIIGGSGGWDTAERSRLWDLGDEVRAMGLTCSGETFFSIMYATITFATLPGFDGLWNEGLGGLAATLPRRRDGTRESVGGVGGSSTIGTVHGKRTDAEAVHDPLAPVDVIRETLAALPNGGNSGEQSWRRWNLVGMQVFCATEGSDEGLAAWDEWSSQHPVHGDEDTCENRWEHWKTSSPPNSTGFGPLLIATREAQRELGTGWTGGEAWRAHFGEKLRAEAAAIAEKMGPIPEKGRGAGAGAALGTSVGKIGAYMGKDAGGVVGLGTVLRRTTIPTSGVTLANLVRAAEEALAGSGYPIMQRGGRLVRPAMLEVDTFHGQRTMTAVLVEIQSMWMLRLISDVADWTQLNQQKTGQAFCHPPEKVAKMILEDAGEWPFAVVHGVSGIPVVRGDGTLFCAAGLDPETGIYVMPDPEVDFDAIRAVTDRRLVLADARAAMDVLDGLLDEFPFVGPEDRSVALSAMLTPVARSGMEVAPAHMLNAPLPGTGKSYLAALCATLALGQAPYVFSAGKDEAEMDKRLHGAVIAGNAVTVIDNVNGVLYGEFLSQMIEQRTLQVRPLGASVLMKIVNKSCLTITGNNVSVTKDMLRKVLECVLDANVEKPENRSFEGAPLARLRERRQEYLTAAYVAIRAHAQAGFPCVAPGSEGRGDPLLSFDGWSRLVRGLIVWTGRTDPVKTMERTRAQDPDAVDLAEFMRFWERRFGLGKKGSDEVSLGGKTTQEILATANIMISNMGAVPETSGIVIDLQVADALRKKQKEEQEEATQFRDLFMRISAGKGGLPDPVRLGFWLRRHLGHVSGNRKLVRGKSAHKVATWSVVSNLRVVSDMQSEV